MHTSSVVSGDTNLWYDRLGRISRSRQCADANCAEIGFDFDEAGRLSTLTYPDASGVLSDDSERLSHHYDSAGRLNSLTGHDPTATSTDTRYANDLSYTALGQLTRLEHSNGVIDTLSYDNTRHWLDTIQVTGSTTLYSASHRHYPDGRIETVTETQPTALQQRYEYDDLGRLTRVGASNPGRNRRYRYDEIGRMASSSTAGTYTYGDPAHVHAPTSTGRGYTRSYDANGNLKTLHDPSGRDLTIDWTVSDMPERIVSNPTSAATVMGYDAADQRVVRHDRSGVTYYFGHYLEQDRKGRLVKYYWAGDRLVARRDGSGRLTDFHQDRLGSTRLLTNTRGNVVERHDYDPFGKPLNPPAQDERLWQGQRLDHESGLIYLSARYYDPTLGRFTSADSIIPDPHNPQTLDPYAYVMNDPANYTDPSGHMPMRIELRKEQAADTTFAWMYFRSLQAQCSWWGQCPIAAGPAGWIYKHTPGRATSKSTPQGSPGSSSPASGGAKTSGRGLSPSKSAPRPGKSAPDSAPVDAGSNPSEAADTEWRYPDDGSNDVGLTIEQLALKYKWDQPEQCDRACQLGRNALGYLGCTGALCGSSGAPRPTSGIDQLAIGMLAAPVVAAAGAIAAAAIASFGTPALTVAGGAGLAPAASRLNGVLSSLQSVYNELNPTSLAGAHEVLTRAVANVNLETGVAIEAATTHIIFQNVGGILTTITSSGAIIVTNSAGQVLLHLGQ